MTSHDASALRRRLRTLGLSGEAIEAAWPKWWSDDAADSVSAQAELRFGVARRLGLDPRSLLDDADSPRFIWRDDARFKHLTSEDQVERAGITSFGRAVAAVLVSATPKGVDLHGRSASDIRGGILGSGRPFVGLPELLVVCWAAGIPTAHLRVFPWPQKRMAAMTVGVASRWSILLGKDAQYPAPIAFFLAHELAHLLLGHVPADEVLVDFEADEEMLAGGDDEEMAADQFALELLTGRPDPSFLPQDPALASGRGLAEATRHVSEDLQIERGTIALCYGHSTGDWRTANAALGHIYASPAPVWEYVNQIAMSQLDSDALSPDGTEFLRAVLGQASGE